MMSLEVIRSMSIKSGAKAAKDNQQPFLVWQEQIECFPPFPFPNIGDYRPDGWKLVDKHFVDKTGFGRPDEPALTIKQFIQKIKPDYGYAIIEEGLFQLYVGEFEKL